MSSEKQNDSPAFRLRPRAEPKSYYTIRLEYSANPAAFTRERPRSSLTKRRDTTKKSSYSRSKLPRANGNKTAGQRYPGQQYDGQPVSGDDGGGGGPIKQVNVMTKEDIEREERRKQLQRELAHSITTDKMISPFLQRLELDELKPSSIYEQNYITLRVDKVSVTKQQATTNNNNNNNSGGGRNEDDVDNILGKHIVCRCSSIDDSSLATEDNNSPTPNKIHLNVHLFDEFANEKLIKVDKIMNIAKFKTGPAISEPKSSSSASSPSFEVDTKTNDHCPNLNFDVIVKYDDSLSSLSSQSSTATITSDSNRVKPLIPYVCITDMIEEPTDPYVEMPPPSPPPPATAHISDTPSVPTVIGVGAADNNGNSYNIKTGG